MNQNARTATLLGLLTQQLMEISNAAKRDDPDVLLRLTSATEQLHGAQVLLELAGMNPLTNQVPANTAEPKLEDHITRLSPKQQAEADRAPEPPPAMPDYPGKGSPEWKQIVDLLRIVKGGKEAETHEVKAAIRGNYPVYQCGDKVRVEGQLTTVIGVRLPLELDTWLYKTTLDQHEQHTAVALERVPNPTPV